MKLFSGWCVIILLDVLVGFRAEYMYPAFMFLRSVVDSYKYQGLVSQTHHHTLTCNNTPLISADIFAVICVSRGISGYSLLDAVDWTMVVHVG